MNSECVFNIHNVRDCRRRLEHYAKPCAMLHDQSLQVSFLTIFHYLKILWQAETAETPVNWRIVNPNICDYFWVTRWHLFLIIPEIWLLAAWLNVALQLIILRLWMVTFSVLSENVAAILKSASRSPPTESTQIDYYSLPPAEQDIILHIIHRWAGVCISFFAMMDLYYIYVRNYLVNVGVYYVSQADRIWRSGIDDCSIPLNIGFFLLIR